MLHLLAVLGEPMRMFTQGRTPSAPDAQLVRSSLGPYIDFAYLHHGYFFFAPNPGPAHLIDISLTDEDGTVRQLRLPNHRAQWPRLLYHRHFMLSEFLYQLYTPPPAETEDRSDAGLRQQWQRDRELFERVRASLEKHAAIRYQAKSASIQLVEHRLPNAVEVYDQKMPLDDERLYVLLPDQPTQSTQPLQTQLIPIQPLPTQSQPTQSQPTQSQQSPTSPLGPPLNLPSVRVPEEVKP